MKPTIKTLEGIRVVKVSSVPKFREWLTGQTMPIIKSDKEPFDWAFYEDYERFIQSKKVID